MHALNELLPPHWSHNNPIDVLGDALPERFAKVIDIAAHDPNIDGLLAITCPQGMAGPTATAEHLKPYAHSTGKPVLASWMGGSEVAAGTDILNQAGIPFSFSRYGRAHVLLHVALQLCAARIVRDAGAPRRR